MVDKFIIDFADQLSPGAGASMNKLNSALEEALDKAKTARIYVVELLLSRAIVNYNNAQNKRDETGMQNAQSVIKQQMDQVAGNGSGNQLGMLEKDLFPPLVNYQKDIMKDYRPQAQLE